MRLAIQGASGRMGQELLKKIAAEDQIRVVATVDPVGRTSARDILDLSPGALDGVVDFSHPKSAMKAAKWCSINRKFFVSGTTGLSRGQLHQLKTLSRRTAILWSPNMSLGIAVLRQALLALGNLGDFDFQVEEVHHRHKMDSPSGTAMELQNQLRQIVKKKLPPPVSIRGGGIRGIHRILAMGEGELITFEHVALDRGIFATGAVQAAIWLEGQRPGLYSFEDLWKLPKNKKSF